DIHGQHQHQSLLRTAPQRELLDAYGGLDEFAARTAAVYREWQVKRDQRAAFETNAAAIAAEREQLDWQVKELAALGFTVEGWQALVAEHARLAHAASLIEGAQSGLDVLSEGDASSLSQLNGVIARLNGLLEYDAS